MVLVRNVRDPRARNRPSRTGSSASTSASTNIATTSDGTRHAGTLPEPAPAARRALRAKLQAKGTKSAKRLLRKRSRKETRFAADTNHVIAKRIVTEAQRTGRGIALEDLTGIRARVRLRKPQRVTLHSWAFAQLGQFTAYKAALAGVPVVHVDPGVHLADVLGVRARQQEEPAAPGHVLLHVVRFR